uniref:FP protein C-terminal domain-containing protein n=1 Tax=Graphocephala atropunctata TaxID=36148 RepID=A0A1B6LMZ9_9HEMI
MTDGVKVTTRNTAKLKTDTEPTAPSLQSIDSKLNSILTLLEKNTSDINDIKKEQKDMCASIELCHVNMNDFKELLTGQDVRISKCENEVLQINNNTCKIRNQVNTVEENVRDLEQYSHRNNLIVYGIPEDKNENIIFVVRRLANALQFDDWSPSLIDAVHRMGRISGSRPRPIIIRFVSRLDKDMFLSKRKVRRNLTASDLGYSSENSIYVNESLTAANRELLKKTRDAARTGGYSHVWTANCSIFARREKGAPAIKIVSEKDLDRM